MDLGVDGMSARSHAAIITVLGQIVRNALLPEGPALRSVPRGDGRMMDELLN